MRVLVVSGYKNMELGIFQQNHPAVTYIKKALYQRIKIFAESGLEWVIISGQLGTELWAAQVVYDLQEEFPHLQLGLFTPYLEQEANWNEKNKEMYEEIVMLASHVDSITKKKYEGPYQLRLKNQFLVNNSQGLLLFYDEEKEAGSKFLLAEAQKAAEHKNYLIDIINFMDLQAIIEVEQND